MANTPAQNKIKDLSKLLFAILVLVMLWALFNDSTYNAIKRLLIKNGDKYTEMYAYSNSKPAYMDKYFIKQGNESAKSFFEDSVNVIDEDALSNVKCSKEDIVLVYEKRSDKVSAYIKGKNGEELKINPGTNIEFYVGIIKSPGSCEVGGQ